MHIVPIVLSVMVALCCVLNSSASKYSQSANVGDIDFENKEQPFRMRKVNLLWSKGRKKLSRTKLADLYADLTIMDKLEINLKKAKTNNKDEDGLLEAKCLKNYDRVVEHFDLDDSFGTKSYNPKNEVLSEELERNEIFEDSKLQSMWNRVLELGFNEKDLDTLKEEFQHQQMKINQLNFMREDLDLDDNGADPHDLKLGDEELHKSYNAMKKDRAALREGYLRLESLITSMPVSAPAFKDSRVHKLWALAKKTNWSEVELESFKEELLHFEHRLSKQAHYQEQLTQSAKMLRDGLSDDKEHLEQHQKLEEKTNFLDRTVSKLYSHFKSRLDKDLRHYEL